ncbi:protein insensitive isoform X2 [Ceratitis capitata]|uniref:protein insensitive isoform X2 n=1 Tax=Ceratitis capitata TaxID=7213 RepID=UPI000A110BC8|nr:protein insensitive isoform X2 [Ceratitis capitata]
MDQSKASCSKNIKELRKVLKETLNIDLKLKRSHHIDDIASEAATIPPTKITPKTYKEQFNAHVGQNVCCQLNKELLVNCYPPYVVIGPNGTRILAKDFNKIDWKTCKGATRKLIGFIFSREAILDTDFAKYSLDPDRLADMEHCLLAKTNGNLYQIQKAFAEKFIDIHMKFYRKHYK